MITQCYLLGPVDVTQIAANFVSSKADVIIRMRGLPFDTKETNVVSLVPCIADVTRFSYFTK